MAQPFDPLRGDPFAKEEPYGGWWQKFKDWLASTSISNMTPEQRLAAIKGNNPEYAAKVGDEALVAALASVSEQTPSAIEAAGEPEPQPTKAIETLLSDLYAAPDPALDPRINPQTLNTAPSSALPPAVYTPQYTRALDVAKSPPAGFYKGKREGGNLVPLDATTIASIMGQAADPKFLANMAQNASLPMGARVLATRPAPISGGGPAAIAPTGGMSGNPPIDAANRVLASQPGRVDYDFTNARPMGSRDPMHPGAYIGNVAPTPNARGSYSIANEPPPEETMNYVSSLYNMGPMYETARSAGYPKQMPYDTATGQSIASFDPRTGEMINAQPLPGAIQRYGYGGKGYVEEAMQAAGIPPGTARELWTPKQTALFNQYLTLMAARAGTGSAYWGQGGVPPGVQMTPAEQERLGLLMGTQPR